MSWQVTAHVDATRLGLALGEADRGHLRRGEDHLGHHHLVDAHRVALERIERRDAAFMGRDGRDLPAPRRVARGIDGRDGAAQIGRDLEPEPLGLEPESPASEHPGVESPPRGQTHYGAADLAAVLEPHGNRAGPAVEPRDARAQPEGHALGLEDLAQIARDLGVEARENLGIAADHGDLGAQVAKGARHLEPDGAGADQREARGKVGEEQQII